MITLDNDILFMGEAIKLARQATEYGEVPVGAVIVRNSDGIIIGKGLNRRESLRSPLAHAEICAIDEAARFLGGWRLSGCTMYVTLEPCPMCAGAIVNSRLDRVVFGAYDKKGGCCGSAANILDIGGMYRPNCCGGVMNEECSSLLKEFFGEKRKNSLDNIKLIEVKTDDQKRRTAEIADEIWHEYFPIIISNEQIDYMVDRFCSVKAMNENTANEGYIYYIISRNGQEVGYTAIKPEKDGRLFLSKIYIYKDMRGKGYSRRVMELHKEFCREKGLNAIWLTVNKHNDTAIAAYKKLGFKCIGEGVSDIGSGFVMDDYYFQLDL